MRRRHKVLWLILLLAAVLFTPLQLLRAQTAPQFGDPLLLPADLLAAFQSGKERFQTVETAATGLGPVHNEHSCAECHSVPVVGGSGPTLAARVIRFARNVEGEPFDPLMHLGGPVHQRLTVAESLPDCSLAAETIPAEATTTSLRQPPSLFGLGLIQAIPDYTILANADPTDADGDGIAGRANISSGTIGRFGWRAAVPTILEFVGLAMVNELGITNYLFPNEVSPQGRSIPAGCDIATDPEDADASRLSGILTFLTYLAPPPRGPITDAVLRGEARFRGVGCTSCHTPSMKTGPHAIAALHEQDVPLYSDLLTHYMGGPLNDHIPEGAAGGGRWRTAPLWGLRTRLFYLHDGRTSDLVEAIGLHGGEASAVRQRFFGLPQAQREDLLAFLRSL